MPAERWLSNLNQPNTLHYINLRLFCKRSYVQGDSLVTTCVYDTSARDKVTLGGLGITDEMCVNYIHYFPKTDLEVCKSSVDSASLSAYFDWLNMK